METKKHKRASDKACRSPMQSPGRPPVWRGEHLRQFWDAIRDGLTTEDAAALASVSSAAGFRWFRDSGGMSPLKTCSRSSRYLSFAEREEIAILRVQAVTVREIARRLNRSPSTITRKIRRNAAPDRFSGR